MFKAYDPDGNLLGDPNGQVGCLAVPPAKTCTIHIEDLDTFPPGTKFDVDVVSVSKGQESEPTSGTTHSGGWRRQDLGGNGGGGRNYPDKFVVERPISWNKSEVVVPIYQSDTSAKYF